MMIIIVEELKEYLICDQHPLADMIFQQARTGQPVWIKFDYSKSLYFPSKLGDSVLTMSDIDGNSKEIGIVTANPDWNIPGAQYSFNPFED